MAEAADLNLPACPDAVLSVLAIKRKAVPSHRGQLFMYHKAFSPSPFRQNTLKVSVSHGTSPRGS